MQCNSTKSHFPNGRCFFIACEKKIREEEFAFSRHPAITVFTSMNVETPTIMAYLFDHPLYLVALIAGVLLFCLRRIMH